MFIVGTVALGGDIDPFDGSLELPFFVFEPIVSLFDD